MTFEQFQATRKWSDDLASAVSSDNWETNGTPRGNLYLGSLYIDHVEPHWPQDCQNQGEWHLLIERDEWISNDLAMLEHKLYNFANSAGYLD